MATAIHLEVLPARLGDCLLVECRRTRGRPWRMLVDGGPPDTWPLLEARLERLGDDRHLDLVVVTHIDSDHIGGMIPMLGSDRARDVGDYWFNGRPHLLAGRRDRSIAQGEALGAALTGRRSGPGLPWNEAFDGGPVDTGEPPGFREVPVEDGPRITVVSPTTDRLAALAPDWQKALDQARRRTREVSEPEEPGPLGNLSQLADEPTEVDSSRTNGTSIGLLVEHRGASVLLAGDGFADVLEQGLSALAVARGVEAIHLDAFKLPHHGSKANLTRTLVEVAPARHYLVSSNGDVFGHPDDAALARVVVHAPTGARLWFNYRNPRTERWADPELLARHRYAVQYPDKPDAGAVLDLPVSRRRSPTEEEFVRP